MTNLKIGVFGCGNMGSALVLGMRAKFPKAEFYLYTPGKIKADDLAKRVGGISLDQNSDMPQNLDWYMLAFKPQNLQDFSFDFHPNSKIISILAGVNLANLTAKFNSKKIVRLMPNMPSAIGFGANLLFLNSDFNQSECEEVNSLLSGAGKIFLMNSEKDLDLTTSFSGSGPALFFEMLRIFEIELTKMTNGRVPAKEIVGQTFFGSAALMDSIDYKNTSFEELRDTITSKKGVTYEALHVLENEHLHEIFSKAFKAAYKRTIELSK